jgi:hypothetical protein
VLEPRRAGQRPRPRQRLLVAEIRQELSLEVRLRRELDVELRQRRDVGEEPRLLAVREVRV